MGDAADMAGDTAQREKKLRDENRTWYKPHIKIEIKRLKIFFLLSSKWQLLCKFYFKKHLGATLSQHLAIDKGAPAPYPAPKSALIVIP